MLQVIKQRKYIQDFIDFTRSFLLTEQVTIDELNLVKTNLDILNKRIADYGETKIGGEDCKELGKQGQGV
ncbi:MAG: hypothetical protein FWB82_05430 [Treponema sp.]|nr:hypothetical protein [Treponema sp.]